MFAIWCSLCSLSHQNCPCRNNSKMPSLCWSAAAATAWMLDATCIGIYNTYTHSYAFFIQMNRPCTTHHSLKNLAPKWEKNKQKKKKNWRKKFSEQNSQKHKKKHTTHETTVCIALANVNICADIIFWMWMQHSTRVRILFLSYPQCFMLFFLYIYFHFQQRKKKRKIFGTLHAATSTNICLWYGPFCCVWKRERENILVYAGTLVGIESFASLYIRISFGCSFAFCMNKTPLAL